MIAQALLLSALALPPVLGGKKAEAEPSARTVAARCAARGETLGACTDHRLEWSKGDATVIRSCAVTAGAAPGVKAPVRAAIVKPDPKKPSAGKVLACVKQTGLLAPAEALDEASPLRKQGANLASEGAPVLAPAAFAGKHLLFFFGQSEAGAPRRIEAVQLQNEYVKPLFDSADLSLTDLQDLDGDGMPELLGFGKPAAPGVPTCEYKPVAVYAVSGGKYARSEKLMEAYAKAHSQPWFGPDRSTDSALPAVKQCLDKLKTGDLEPGPKAGSKRDPEPAGGH